MKVRTVKLLILIMILFALVPCAAQAKIIAVSHGLQTVLALNDQGNIWMWGNGNPPGNARMLPIDDVTAIAAGGSNYALKKDGTVWAWGYGGHGRLGNGDTATNNTPVQVSGLTDVIAISAGYQNGYALKKDGTVWAWGENGDGQLGIGRYGTPDFVTTPVQVLGLTDIVALGNGGYAIKKDGTVYTWLNDTLAYLGGELVPFRVPYVDNVKQIAYFSFTYTVFLKNDGTVWVWGDNQYGEMGNGTRTSYSLGEVNVWPPVQATITDVKQIATWFCIVDALKNDGTVWEWGASQLPRPPSEKSIGTLSPVQVSGLDHVVQISTGIALKDDGTVWGWGQNFDKCLKDATDSTVVTSPIMVFKEPEQAATPTPALSPTATPTPTIEPSNTSAPSKNTTVTPVVTPATSSTVQPAGTTTPFPDDSGLLLQVAGIAGLVLVAGAVVYFWITKRL
jgi:alpha-tubulin suppressor-like RCC1 family protein